MKDQAAGGVGDLRCTEFSVPTPSPFDFSGTAHSHGWCVLAPTSWEPEAAVLERTERLAAGRVVRLRLSDKRTESGRVSVRVEHTGSLSPEERSEIGAIVARMLRLDEDLSEFYARCAERGGHWVRLTTGLGRLLCSPTVFEDVCKTLATTNIQWGGTKGMVRRLVEAYGDPFPGSPDLRAFPTPLAIAAADPAEFAATVRMGYRAPYVYTLATEIAEAKSDLEALRDPTVPTPELRKRLLALRGVGPYAAATLLMLLGRYDDVAVDTWFRSLVTKKYFGGNRPSDAEAKAVYDEWGRWKYLAFWFDHWDDDTEL